MEETKVELRDAIVDLICEVFCIGKAPARKWIVQRIQEGYPEFDNPKLDLQVAVFLNHKVDKGILQRKNGMFYHPGPLLRKKDGR